MGPDPPSSVRTRLARRKLLTLGLATALWPGRVRAQSESTELEGWTRWDTGVAGARTARHVKPGLLLMGGSGRNEDAFRWLAERADGGHLLILASRGGAWRAEWMTRLGVGFASYTTAVTHERNASADPALVAAVREADAVLLSGGGQDVYLNLWRNSPLQAALQQHAQAGRPLAGLSAGLAIMGQWCFTAERGSVSAQRVLADPFSDVVAIEPGLLSLPPLAGTITDSHFSERGRLGRLAGFLVNLRCERQRPAVGLGVDERTSLALADHEARVFSDDGGAVHRVDLRLPASACRNWPEWRHNLKVEVKTAEAGSRFEWPWSAQGAALVDL
jgi:L-asparaginase / beta-aspartyl-peptidase